MRTISKGNKKIIITRTKLSDGYNYYLMLIVTNEFTGMEFWDESYRQTKSIFSFREAISTAKKVIN